MDISANDVFKDPDGILKGLNDGERYRLSRDAEREFGRRSTYYLARYILGYNKLNNDFHVALCRHHDRFMFDLQLHLHPRKHYKTTLVTISGKIRLALLDPNITICIIANTLHNSQTFLKELRAHFIHNDHFRDLYPEHAVEKKREEGTADRFTTPARTNMTERMETFEAASADRAIVSRHYKLMAFDDFVDDKNTATPDLNLKLYDNYATSLSVASLTPQGRPWHHIVGTRWSYNDPYQRILDDDKEDEHFNKLITQAYWKTTDEKGASTTEYLFPEQFPPNSLDYLRKSQGVYKFSCTPGFGKIWMADGSFKRIDEVEVGDEVVGFRKKSQKKHARMTIVKSMVKKVQSRVAPVVQEVVLDNETAVYCTPEHKWYTGRNDETHRPYAPVSVGSRVVRAVSEPMVDEDIQSIRDWAWLGGMFDGEGGLTHTIISISQSMRHNKPVIEKLRSVLTRLGLGFNEFHKEEKDVIMFYLLAPRDVKLRILANMDFAKRYQLVAQLFKMGCRIGHSGGKEKKQDGKCGPKVVAINRFLENQPVYALVTETGNYCSQNYWSSNCLYLNSPTPEGEIVFDPSYLKDYDDTIPSIGRRHRVITLDPSSTVENRKGDPTVIGCYECDPDFNVYIREIRRGWWNPDQIIDELLAMHKLHKVRDVGIEAVAFQKWLCFYTEKKRKDEGYHFKVIPIKRSTHTSKKDRLDRIGPVIREGKLFIRKDEPEREIIRRELREYPYGRYDDFLDTLADAIELLKPPSKRKKEGGEQFRRPPVVLHGRNFQTGYSTWAGGR